MAATGEHCLMVLTVLLLAHSLPDLLQLCLSEQHSTKPEAASFWQQHVCCQLTQASCLPSGLCYVRAFFYTCWKAIGSFFLSGVNAAVVIVLPCCSCLRQWR